MQNSRQGTARRAPTPMREYPTKSTQPILARLLLIPTILFVVSSNAFAQLTDTIRPGHPALADALPYFGTDTIESWQEIDGEKKPTNTQIRTIERFQEKDGDVILITVTHIPYESADTTVNLTMIRTDDLSLIRQRVRSDIDSGQVTYALGVVSGWMVPPDEEWHPLSAHVGRRVFADDGIAPWLIGLLPLEPDYEAAIAMFNMWDGTEVVQTVRVVGSGEVVDGGRAVDCWKLEVTGDQGPPGYRQIRFISKESRRLIKGGYVKGTDDPQWWGAVRNWF